MYFFCIHRCTTFVNLSDTLCFQMPNIFLVFVYTVMHYVFIMCFTLFYNDCAKPCKAHNVNYSLGFFVYAEDTHPTVCAYAISYNIRFFPGEDTV